MTKKRVREFTTEDIVTLDDFVDAFVIERQRIRARKLLLGDSEQRIAAIQRLPEWLDPGVCVTAVTSRDLKAKFSGLQGRLFDHARVSRVAIDDAETYAGGGFGAVFISDDNKVALLIPEVGESALCVRTPK